MTMAIPELIRKFHLFPDRMAYGHPVIQPLSLWCHFQESYQVVRSRVLHPLDWHLGTGVTMSDSEQAVDFLIPDDLGIKKRLYDSLKRPGHAAENTEKGWSGTRLLSDSAHGRRCICANCFSPLLILVVG